MRKRLGTERSILVIFAQEGGGGNSLLGDMRCTLKKFLDHTHRLWAGTRDPMQEHVLDSDSFKTCKCEKTRVFKTCNCEMILFKRKHFRNSFKTRAQSQKFGRKFVH